jgi:tetratricopeptide (TPR) repeat protein
MRLAPLAAATCLALCTLSLTSGARSHAQDGRAPDEGRREGARPDGGALAGDRADVLRARGASAWRNYVWSLDRTRLARSIDELERARELNGGRADVTQVYLIAFGHLVLGNAEPGGAAAAQLREEAPEFGATQLLDAFESIVAGDDEAAHTTLSAFVAHVEAAPTDAAFHDEFKYLAYLHRGAHRYDMGLHGQAVVDLRHAIRIAREADREPSSVVMLRLARAHQSLDEHGAAAALIGELLRRDPANADLYHNLGLLEGTQKRLPEARAWYERALARRRNYGAAHGKLGFVAWRDADVDPAELRRMRRHISAYGDISRDSASARTLADVESGHGMYWFAVARHRIDHGYEAAATEAFERALRHFEAAVDHEPGCVRALNSIIKIGAQLEWPPERIAPYRERINAIMQADEHAPAEHRSSFC